MGRCHLTLPKEDEPVGSIHAWDCRCGTRNAPTFAKCRRCCAPSSAGRSIPTLPAPPLADPLADWMAARGQASSISARWRVALVALLLIGGCSAMLNYEPDLRPTLGRDAKTGQDLVLCALCEGKGTMHPFRQREPGEAQILPGFNVRVDFSRTITCPRCIGTRTTQRDGGPNSWAAEHPLPMPIRRSEVLTWDAAGQPYLLRCLLCKGSGLVPQKVEITWDEQAGEHRRVHLGQKTCEMCSGTGQKLASDLEMGVEIVGD